MLTRAESGDPEGDDRRHWLLMTLLEDYFSGRGKWYLGPKRSLTYLQREKPEDFAVLCKAFEPPASIADVRAYRAAAKVLGLARRHLPGHPRGNNRVENSHQPIRRRERVIQRFESQASAQQFAAADAAVYNVFNARRHLLSRRSLRRLRTVAMTTWAAATVNA